jgi:hydrogenase/urease accessory protein HupE
MKTVLRRVVLAGAVGLVAAHAVPARAHTVGVSRGEYRVSGSSLEADLVFARPELAMALPALDADRDGSVSAGEVPGARALLADVIVRALVVRAASGPCEGRLDETSLTEEDGLLVRAVYRCAGPPTALRAGFVSALSLGHRHIASASGPGAEPVHAVAFESRPDLELPGANGAAAAVTGVAGPLLRLGIQHILTGYDHLLFLLGLILVGGRLRPLLVMVTAFTVAHSITLGLAVLGVWAPSPSLVEPAIALSICYVGIENWFVRDASRRWLITAPFGLVHGFGFAGALKEISLPAADVPLALASFNVGVEAGQLAVLAVILPLVLWLGRKSWFPDAGVKTVSAAIAVAGLCWFVSRLAA